MKTDKMPLIKTPDGAYTYGANQAWFKDPKARKAGCGSVSAAHLIYALSGSSMVYREVFEVLMTDIYRSMGAGFGKKNPTGISVGRYTRSVLRYGLKNNLCLKAHILLGTYTHEDKARRFIKDAIDQGYLITLNMGINKIVAHYQDQPRPSAVDISYHFVTISDYTMADDGDMTLTISTWGHKATISFKELYLSWQSPLAVDSGMIYFTKEGSPASVRKQICHSYLLVLRTLLRVPGHLFAGQF
ncbi:MAG: hypothetical protein KBS83_03935 [Lachnospiraceae bacterium]|nr:hypothetical protein [Candidatus Equihabitans merdae]